MMCVDLPVCSVSVDQGLSKILSRLQKNSTKLKNKVDITCIEYIFFCLYFLNEPRKRFGQLRERSHLISTSISTLLTWYFSQVLQTNNARCMKKRLRNYETRWSQWGDRPWRGHPVLVLSVPGMVHLECRGVKTGQ